MRSEYPYLYETHLHTNQSSACAWNTGYEMAEAAHRFGYAGIIVTDHNWGGNTATDRSLPWRDWVLKFSEGYLDAKRYADEHPDFEVFFGYEAGFSGTEFLIYDISPQWLMDHPEIRDASLQEHLRMVRSAGGTVIHAHPFREAWYISEILLFPELVDGVEGINATHSCHLSSAHYDKQYDIRAVDYANEHGLPMSAGSDIHSTQLFGGGVAFRRRIRSIADYCAAIRGDEDRLLTNGDTWFDRKGNPLPGEKNE